MALKVRVVPGSPFPVTSQLFADFSQQFRTLIGVNCERRGPMPRKVQSTAEFGLAQSPEISGMSFLIPRMCLVVIRSLSYPVLGSNGPTWPGGSAAGCQGMRGNDPELKHAV